jgi:hypothetical protein
MKIEMLWGKGENPFEDKKVWRHPPSPGFLRECETPN